MNAIGFCKQKCIGGLMVLIALGTGFSADAENRHKIEVVPNIQHMFDTTSHQFSPDGQYLLTGSTDGTIKLWDSGSGQLMRTFHNGVRIESVAFSPDGTRILSGSTDKTLKLWEAATGRLIRTFRGHTAPVTSVAFSGDGKHVVSGSKDTTIRIWNAASGLPLQTLKGHSGLVYSTAFSPDGKLLLSGCLDNMLKLWDASSGRALWTITGEGADILRFAFSPDGKQIISGSKDNILKLWSVSGQLIRTFPRLTDPDKWTGELAFSLDGSQVLSFDGGLRVWDRDSGRLIRSVDMKIDEHAVFSPDRARLFSGNFGSSLRLSDVTSGEVIRTMHGDISDGGVGSLAFSPDGRRLLVGSHNTLRLWDAISGQHIRTLEGHNGYIRSVAFSSDDARLVSGSDDMTLRIWNAFSGEQIAVLRGHSETINSVAVSPDSARLVSGGGDKTLKLWDAVTGQLLRSFQGHAATINSVGFSPDGTQLLSGSDDKTLKLWSVATGQLIRTFKGHSDQVYSVAFSPDGEHLLSGSADKTLKLWRASSGRLIRTIDGHSQFSRVAISPDGTRLLSGGLDSTLALWDVNTGKLIKSFKGHTFDVDSVAFSPDGKRLVSSSLDSTMRIWSATTGHVATLFTSREWLTMIPEGFLLASPKADQAVAIVRGFEVTNIHQVYQALYDPNLVRERLAGDPDGEVKKAAAELNLEKVLDSGKAPGVVLVSPAAGALKDEVIAAQARLIDSGGGIGRIEWRVNGITTGVVGNAPGSGRERTITQALSLEPGENTIEVVAYNGRNLLASLPASTTVTWTPSGPQPKSKLFVIAVGINDYSATGFSSLRHAVADAKAFGAAMKAAGEGLYGDVEVIEVPDAKATATGLEKVIDEVGARMHPRDTFIFFAAAHGKSEQGRFHLIPHDYRSAPGRPISEGSIGQDKLQDWFANRIKARRGLILLDTCESGALVASRPSGVDAGNSEAALGRLNEATGRPVLTAAAADQVALEGYKGHGIFTYALLDALVKGDTNNNGTIELNELTAHIQTMAPQLSHELRNSGKQVTHTSRAALTSMGNAPVTSRYADFRQKPRIGSRGEDFAIGKRLAVSP